MKNHPVQISAIRDMRDWSARTHGEGCTIAFVPTMGALHEGHLSLVRLACGHADRVAVSIFVNPTQFAPGEDYSTYPRDLDRDTALLAEVGCNVVFIPSASEIYPPDFSTNVTVGGLTERLCGKSRPDHFSGVATIVTKLFSIVSPDVAVFGMKDAQQLAVIKRLVRDLHVPVRIVEAPIVRESDGVAMSSRNANLTPDERVEAKLLNKSLQAARKAFSDGERDARQLKSIVGDILAVSTFGRVDYVECVDRETLKNVDEVVKPVLLAIAVGFSRARLIDNTVLKP